MKNVHVITGGGSGIGLSIAKLFKEDKVLITSRNEKRLQGAIEMLKAEGIDADYKTVDISSRESLKELFDYAKSLGPVKSVINSAGVSGVGTDAEMTFKIDLIGTKYIVEGALEVIEPGSVVILIASMMGYAVPSNEAYDKYLRDPELDGALETLLEVTKGDSNRMYNFTKKGVHLIMKDNVDRFGAKGARIVTVSPGIIMTDMARKAAEDRPEQMKFLEQATPIQRLGHPDDISNVVEFLVSDKASFITGSDIPIDGGLHLNLHKLAKSQ